MSKPSARKCMHCRQRAVSPVTLPSYAIEMEHDGRKYQVTITDFRVLQCEHCAAIILDDSANERLDDALRSEAGLVKHPIAKARGL